jgi:hypothetical protein
MPGESCVLATFSDPIEANLVVHRLMDEGIPARVSGDMTGGLFGMGYALGGMDILVSETDLERAELVLERIMAEHEDPWDRDVLPRDALAVTVEPDDPERSQAIQVARGMDNEPRQVYEGPPANVVPAAVPEAEVPDEPEPPPLPTAAGDRIANHAFRAAVFAWLLGPLMPVTNLYSLILLFQTGGEKMPLSREGTVKYYVALIVDLVIIGMILMVFISYGWRLYFWPYI